MSLVFLFYLLFPIALIISIIVSIVILINAILKNDTKKIKKMAIVIALLLMPIAYHYAKIAFYNSNSIPDANPHPTLKMRVYGDYPYENDTNMKIGIRFKSNNINCNRDKWLLDNGGSRHKIKTFPTTIKNGKFESIIYFDSYLPGICQWEAEEIYAYVQSKNNISIYGKESIFMAQKDVFVSWDSDQNELIFNGKIKSKSQYEFELHRSTQDKYGQIFSKKVKFPADIKIGLISHISFQEQGRTLYVECLKKRDTIDDKNKTTLDCREFFPDNDFRYWKYGTKNTEGIPKISTTQKEIQVNFIDKGWGEQ